MPYEFNNIKNIKIFYWLLFILIMLFFILISTTNTSLAAPEKPLVITIEIGDMVTAGTAKHVQRSLQLAEKENADAVVIMLNTPGGLVTATLDIIRDISSSEIPVITYVAPRGAIAASAGTFILLGGHVAAMSPGTTCGAAMPVTMTPAGGETQKADEKTINFMAGHIRSIAQERGRPTDIAEKFVTENLTLDYTEALNEGIIDYIAADLNELLEKLDGTEIRINDTKVILNTANAEVKNAEQNSAERLTHLVSNPQIAFILLLIGIYGLVIGFKSPGTFLPEVLGGISLVLALYGLGMFEVNLLAFLLILLGTALLVAEAFTPTYGVLGVGGVVSIVLGILFLPVEPMLPASWFSRFRLTAITVGIISAIFMLIILTGIIRLRKAPVVHGREEFKLEKGTVIEELNPEGLIKIRGEIWKARAKSGQTIPVGEKIKVVEREDMIAIVEPVEKQEE